MTDFREGFQYLGGVLQFIQHAEGYVNYLNSGGGKYNYVFNYLDHLGNVRASFAKDPATGLPKILKENHYYPFGLKHPYNSLEFDFYYNSGTGAVYLSQPTNKNKYQYNGKEFQSELCLNLYDYGARMFDPAIGRWGVVDPLAEKYQSWSPYNYVYNNPLKFVDPTGMEGEWYPDPKDNTKLISEKDDNWKTLSQNWPVSANESKNLTKNLKKDENGNVVAGQKVQLNNNFAKSFSTNDGFSNCHSTTFNFAKGNVEEGMKTGGDIDYMLKNDYIPINHTQKIPGKTIGRIGGVNNEFASLKDVKNINNHDFTFYGSSKNGTDFFIQRESASAKITINTLNEILNLNYGTIQGIPKNIFSTTKDRTPITGHTGWYNPR